MTAQHTRPALSPKARGFTLVELMLAVTISGFVLAGAYAFIVASMKSYEEQSVRLLTNADLRKLTTSLQTDAAFANHFYIYDVDTNGVIPTTPDTAHPDPTVGPGGSGDLALLVTTHTDDSGNITFTRVVAYYRGDPTKPLPPPPTSKDPPTPPPPLPIYRIDSGTLNPGVAAYDTSQNPAVAVPICTLYNKYIAPNIIKAMSRPFLESALVLGQASNETYLKPTNVHPNLFYNLGGVCMVRSLIYEQLNNHADESVDTFNFTLRPRG